MEGKLEGSRGGGRERTAFTKEKFKESYRKEALLCSWSETYEERK